MRYLLDSHVLLWRIAGSPRLGPLTRAILLDANSEIFVSVASLWELAAKASRGGLPIPSPLVPRLVETLNGTAELLQIRTDHVAAMELLPRHHGDPFDRMLIAQAQAEGLVLVTADGVMTAYDIALHDAGR